MEENKVVQQGAAAGGWQLYLPLEPVAVVSSDLMSIGAGSEPGSAFGALSWGGFSADIAVNDEQAQQRGFPFSGGGRCHVEPTVQTCY